MTYHQMLHIIISNRTAILKVSTLATILIFLILFFVFPVNYKAPATVLPPQESNQMGSLGSLLAGQDFSNLLLGGIPTANSQLYIEILKSRTAAEYVVKKNNLIKYYDADNLFDASDILRNHLITDLSKEGIITVSVDVSSSMFPLFTGNLDSTKRFAAALSNSYIQALDSINLEKLTSKAKKARIYIESQLKTTKIHLDSVESQLMKFQEEHKTVSLPEQLQATITAAANLKAEMIKTEVEIGLFKSNLKDNSRILQAMNKKLNQLKEQYDKIEFGTQDYLIAFSEVPELGKALASLLRDVKIQNEVYLLLQQQYYKEKIQENRNLPTVEVLDEAIPPLKASGPRVIFSSIMGGITVFLLISLIFIVKEKKNFELKLNSKGN